MHWIFELFSINPVTVVKSQFLTDFENLDLCLQLTKVKKKNHKIENLPIEQAFTLYIEKKVSYNSFSRSSTLLKPKT